MDSHEETLIDKPKSFGMFRSLMGSVLGVFVFFLFITVPVNLLLDNSLPPGLFVIISLFEIWGRLVVAVLRIDRPEIPSNIVITLISMIPPAIWGWMIGSSRKPVRITGIVLLLLYLLLTIGLGMLALLITI